MSRNGAEKQQRIRLGNLYWTRGRSLVACVMTDESVALLVVIRGGHGFHGWSGECPGEAYKVDSASGAILGDPVQKYEKFPQVVDAITSMEVNPAQELTITDVGNH